ncbi:hypothetical protein DM02DRAFT_524252 [Periconia macrospinosa]|uniref:Osmotin, thaumatin-like protein n=1 Tax=Periconia macrospinosa TaxID=97972 RepID=A0A2V1DV10_9PLEO|nr:hypothetical protein DM02DRAFT_524252 [Periconia macrospinosa]
MQFKNLLVLGAAISSAAATADLSAVPRNAIERFLGKPEPVASRSLEARGLGNAIFENRCSYDVWIWSVDGKGSSGAKLVPKRTKYTEPVRTSCPGCGVVIKVSKTNQIVNGKHTQFEYTVGDKLWYDISYVNCAKDKSADNCPGHEKGNAMQGLDKDCGQANCRGGTYCPEQSYYVDQPLIKLGIKEPVFACPVQKLSGDISMRLCSDEKPLAKRSVAGRLLIDE